MIKKEGKLTERWGAAPCSAKTTFCGGGNKTEQSADESQSLGQLKKKASTVNR